MEAADGERRELLIQVRPSSFSSPLLLRSEPGHAKRSTVTSEDVKLLARRSNSLLKYITQKSEELASSNMEQKEKKKKSSAAKGRRTEENEAPVTESEDSNMA
ncbi:hypothetical protein ASZ78_014672 [Callipepla squamata]|uniref:Centromere protein S n=1 Tax=Callipepla squamata TaxID=9009 RepID=A0A226MN78_CALSU|nr:hypothetical protein ASZ78_014672 [Callipepla squamata]